MFTVLALWHTRISGPWSLATDSESSEDYEMAYRDLLATSLASSPTAPDHDQVGAFLFALVNLNENRRSGTTEDTSQVIAYELGYDRALINLSLTLGIDTGPERFDVPSQERDRLHRALVQALPSLHEVIFPAED